MAESKTNKGISTELKFFSYCLDNDIVVCQPVTTDTPYDCIFEGKSGRLYKAQLKTGYRPAKVKNQKDQNVFTYSTRTSHFSKDGVASHGYTKCQIDGFITYFNELPDMFFYIPIELSKKGSMRIYFGDKPTAQSNYYKDFLLDFSKL